ncbi:BlaI/MecI/CopY family transcriptional regulator [Dietzia kunjamensis]|uniref:BlaI/MecI/CopY family transcriptional regulator n=1 Tax=Dietzia maris TaxID=37915 RepID=A0ABT8GZW6_9ACTN|nr:MULTISPECIES: BlaI/MecI/CopY family transcriptional regulator [Dietzia]MCZ4540311.1 BlaI/MecI/CopY family transcriptional regulator [Dietzia maris]MCZ4655745.1 BlaI/MecI/CopY family transcriptional regulator [Dietzia kunjamensis]MDJ0422437.1 BlaI/MecI/CopY family transcriptional regulator [Dietzia kunjamensis]MDN4505753.1 BlaI/MecI/CopY family transcriptional regulator [Dietzia maris]
MVHSLPGLGELETAVLELLWDECAGDGDDLSVREVSDRLADRRPLAYTTVMTVLAHLYDKGAVTREKVGRGYRYRPARSREDFGADALGELLLSSGDAEKLLLHFVSREGGDLAPEEAGVLRRITARLRGSGDT